MNILEKFNPLLTSALERYQRFKDPEPRDIQKIFGPALETICNVAGVDPARAIERIGSWGPAAVTMELLTDAVRDLTAPTMSGMEAIRAKQATLDAEMAETVLPPRAERWDPSVPLSERSRASLLAELKAETLNYNSMGCDGSRYEAISAELQERDCRTAGYNYTPLKAKPRANSTAYLQPMRG